MKTEKTANISYDLKADNIEPYNKRTTKALWSNLIPFGIFAVIQFVVIKGYSVEISFIILLMYTASSITLIAQERFYISSILIKDDSVDINYWDKNKLKHLEGNINDFSFKKKREFSIRYSSIPYLKIYFKGKSAINQFVDSPNWSRDKIEEIISLFK